VLERQIAELDDQIRVLVEPLMPQLAQLVSIPGVDMTAARDILGEMGTDMRRCDSAARVVSWAKVSPGNNASAGTRRPGRTGKGHRSVRCILGR
jgi:transposase